MSSYRYRLKESLGVEKLPRINKFSVARKRVLRELGPEGINKMMSNARKGVTADSYKNRKYSKEGLASLRKNIFENVQIPGHCRNQDFRKDPIYKRMMGDLMRERIRLGINNKVHEEKETKRINDYAGVITLEEMESL